MVTTRVSNRDRLISALSQPDTEHRILAIKMMGFTHNEDKYRYELILGSEVVCWVEDAVLLWR